MGSRWGLILREFTGLLLKRRQTFRVAGRSMQPTLDDGDVVVVRPAERAKPGVLVVVSDPRDDRRVMVKRVSGLGTETFSVSSDNPLEGTDSRQFGSIPWRGLIGTVTLFWRKDGTLVDVVAYNRVADDDKRSMTAASQ